MIDNLKKAALAYLTHLKLVIFDVLMVSVLSLTLNHTSDVMGHIEGDELLGWAAAIVIECGIIASAYITLDRSEVISKYRLIPIALTVLLIIFGDGFNTNYYLRHPVKNFGLWELDSKQVAWLLGAFLPVTACFMGVIRGILHQVYYPIADSKPKVEKPKKVIPQGVVVQPDNVVNFKEPLDKEEVYRQFSEGLINAAKVKESGCNINTAKSYKARIKKEREKA